MHDPWPGWVESTAITVLARVWLRWVEARASDGTVVPVIVQPGAADDPTTLTRLADAQLLEQRRAAAAQERAEAALLAQLTEAQQAQLRRDNFFVVRGSGGGLYQVHRGDFGRCARAEGDRIVEHLCVHPRESDYPDADALLTTKLWLEADEPGLRRIANITRSA